MFDKLENCLNKWVSPERRESIMAGFVLLEKYGRDTTWSETSAYLEYATDDSLSVIIDTIEAKLNNGLDSVAIEHTLVIDGSISLKTEVLEGVYLLQNWEDAQTIINLATETEDPNYALANLVAFVNGKKYTDYDYAIVTVSPTLLEKLVGLYSAENDDSDTDNDGLFMSHDERRVKLVSQFIDANKETMAFQAIVEDFRPIGIPLELLLNDHRLALAALEPMGHIQAATEIVGLCVISDVPVNDIARVAKDTIDVVYADMNFIMKVEMAMTEKLAEVQRYGQV